MFDHVRYRVFDKAMWHSIGPVVEWLSEKSFTFLIKLFTFDKSAELGTTLMFA